MKYILVINCGSSSLKYKVFSTADFSVQTKGGIEKIGEKDSVVVNHTAALEQAFKEIEAKGINKNDVVGVGHRVVHGGEKFKAPALIDDGVIEGIRENIKLAPLHNPANLEGILAALKVLPGVKNVAIFDTAFHSNIPEYAYMYALPYKLYEQEKIRRYGFHGTSHSYVSRKAAELLGKKVEDIKVIVVHLGNGGSISAVKGGVSIDTSMGFTPLAGLVMGTRCGDIDPSIVLHMSKQLNYTTDQIDKMLNKESGLLGISGISNDMRELKKARKENNPRAKLAIDMLLYSVKKYVGAYLYVLGGVDAIVFTAGIGENSPEFLEYVTADMEEFLKHPPRAMIIPTDEELEIARLTSEKI